MAETWYIPGVGNVTTPNNPTSLPPGAVKVQSASPAQTTPSSSGSGSTTHTILPTPSTTSGQVAQSSSPTSGLSTSVINEIRRKAESNLPLDSPTPQTQALYDQYRKQVLEEIARKASVGATVTNPANEQTWMGVVASAVQPGAITNITETAKNVSQAHPGLVTIGAILMGILLFRR